MALFPERFINQVQQATDIVEVIGQYIALKKAGKDFVGLCPFHQDHHASMNVSPTKQIFKCFACQAGGGVFQFLMQFNKLSFPEAVRQLADRAGIPVPKDEAAVQGDQSLAPESLHKLMAFAAKYFRERLFSAAGEAALAYARRRKLTDESIERFGLGFAPDGWDGLKSAAMHGGFSERQLIAAGLAVPRESGGSYDRFRNRLIFPIYNSSDKIIAFGGRALAADERAKYLNSPETVLFDKSANLYGINWSRRAIVDAEQAVVVEGYLDAVMPMQAGIANVVATLGTALTERHVRMLGRYAKEVVLVYDADTAGQAAAERAIELFLSQQVQVRIVTLPVVEMPEGGQTKDPCDYVLTAGADAFRAVLAAAPDALAFAWTKRSAEYRAAGSLAEKRKIVEEFLQLIVTSTAYGAIDTLRQGLLVAHLSDLIGMSIHELTDQMRRLARQVKRTSQPLPPDRPAAAQGSSGNRAESWLLGALLNQSDLFAGVMERVDPAMFTDPMLRAVAEVVWRLGAEDHLDLAGVLNASESATWGAAVTNLQAEGEKRGNYAQTVTEVVAEFARRGRQDELAIMKSQTPVTSDEHLRQVADHARQSDKRRLPRV